MDGGGPLEVDPVERLREHDRSGSVVPVSTTARPHGSRWSVGRVLWKTVPLDHAGARPRGPHLALESATELSAMGHFRLSLFRPYGLSRAGRPSGLTAYRPERDQVVEGLFEGDDVGIASVDVKEVGLVRRG